MTLAFKASLPIPPSVNKSKGGKNYKTGQFYNAPKLSAWQKEADHILKGCRLELSQVRYHYTFFPKNKTFGDTENYCKAVTDALVQAGVIQDDKHTCLLKGSFEVGGYDPKVPRVEVEIHV